MSVQEILKMNDESITDYHLIVDIALFVIQNNNKDINNRLTKKINPKFLSTGVYPLELKPIESRVDDYKFESLFYDELPSGLIDHVNEFNENFKNNGYLKHCNLIRKWAEGHAIQIKNEDGSWSLSNKPSWKECYEYRVADLPVFDGNFRQDRLYKLKVTNQLISAIGKRGEMNVQFLNEHYSDEFFQFIGQIAYNPLRDDDIKNFFFCSKDSTHLIYEAAGVDYVCAEYDQNYNLLQEYATSNKIT